jgi:prohibitin 2
MGLFGITITMILIVLLWSHIVITVPAGHVGVLWLRFFGGTVANFSYNEGTKVIFPWDRVFLYDARMQRIDETYKALTSDGLTVRMSVSATFFINRNRVGTLHARFGDNYPTTLIAPTIASQVNLIAANRIPSELHSLARAEMVHQMIQGISQKIVEASRDAPNAGAPLIDLVELNIHDVELPRSVQASIENKLSAEEDVQRRQSLLESEQLESQRRIVDAEGTRRVQEIITPGLTGPFLRWQANDALTRLVQQRNNKTIVLGPGVGLGSVILDGSSGGSSNLGQPDRARQTH